MSPLPESIWQPIAMALFGALSTLVTLLIGTYTKRTRDELDRLRERHDKLNEYVRGELHPKGEVDRALDALGTLFKDFTIRYEQDMRDIRNLMTNLIVGTKGE